MNFKSKYVTNNLELLPNSWHKTGFQDHKGNQLYLGINHLGILTFQGSRKTNHFRWSEVHKINYEGKMFIIHLIYQEVCATNHQRIASVGVRFIHPQMGTQTALGMKTAVCCL